MFTFIKNILKILFPDYCLVCNKYGTVLCNECLNRLEPAFISKVQKSYSLYNYKDINTLKIIHFLKKNNHSELSEKIANKVLESIQEDIITTLLLHSFKQFTILTIPSSKERIRKYSFHQMASIAKNVASELSSVYKPQLLFRKREPAKQASLRNRQDRLLNMKNVFDIKEKNKKYIQGKTFLILDDVVTTGATINDAYRTLLKNGAKQCFSITIAH